MAAYIFGGGVSPSLATCFMVFKLAWLQRSATACDAAYCSYNGICQPDDHTCSCLPQWTGKYCETLNVIPGFHHLGYHGLAPQGGRLSSWGGAAMRAEDGTYWMAVSEIIGGAGMTPWCCNSHVILARSLDPLREPFTRERVLWPTFSHEPRCTQAPDGRFVCYFSHGVPASPPCSGKDGETDAGCSCDWRGPKPTYMSFASEPNGTWSEPVRVAETEEPTNDLNLAPYIFANGSLLALYRDNRGSNIHVLTASDWRNPSSYRISTSDLNIALPEDPFLWRDAHGVFHTINHQYPWPSGVHAWSLDGLTWHTATGEYKGHAYQQNVTFTDAPPKSAGCRERPSLLFAADGTTPIGLVNGFSPDPSHVGDSPSGSCRFNGVDYSYTLVQPLHQTNLVV